MKPKRLWSLTLLLLINTFHAAAQQLLITDDEGHPVGFAHVLNHNGTVLSVSNLDGTADDADGFGGQYEFYILCSGSSYSCGNALPYFGVRTDDAS